MSDLIMSSRSDAFLCLSSKNGIVIIVIVIVMYLVSVLCVVCV